MISFSFAVNALGIVVGLGALSLAVFTITLYRGLYDSSFVAALYIIGLIIVFLSLEVPMDEGIYIPMGRLAIFLAVGYWELVVLRAVWMWEGDDKPRDPSQLERMQEQNYDE